jgi:predicted DNA-binding transcriptional regulator AlpA
LGANMVRWKASDIEAWMIAREASLWTFETY